MKRSGKERKKRISVCVFIQSLSICSLNAHTLPLSDTQGLRCSYQICSGTDFVAPACLCITIKYACWCVQSERKRSKCVFAYWRSIIQKCILAHQSIHYAVHRYGFLSPLPQSIFLPSDCLSGKDSGGWGPISLHPFS